MKKRFVENDTVVKNGEVYLIDPKTKTCKRLAAKHEVTFVMNPNVEEMDEQHEKDNTRVLYKSILPDFPDARMTGKWINVADYKIRYSSHGFIIHDMRKSGEILNINKWNNDFPNPEMVLEFIKSTVKRVPTIEVKVNRKEVERGELMKMARMGKITFTNAMTGEPVKSQMPVAKKDRLYMDLERLFLNYKDGKTNYRETASKLKQRSPEALRPVMKQLLDAFKNKTTTWRKLLISLDKDVNEYLAVKKAEKPVRQPKFEAPDLMYPIDCPKIIVVDEVIEELKSKNVVMPDMMWMQFETRGASGKRVSVTTTVEHYLSCEVLAIFPKAMPLLMKVAKGEMEAPMQHEINMKTFVKDPYMVYDKQWMMHPVDRNAFCNLCFDILHNEGDCYTCFDVMWCNDFKNGDLVSVYSNTNFMNQYGTVIGTEGGLEVRYADGEVGKVRKYDTVKLYNWKKK